MAAPSPRASDSSKASRASLCSRRAVASSPRTRASPASRDRRPAVAGDPLEAGDLGLCLVEASELDQGGGVRDRPAQEPGLVGGTAPQASQERGLGHHPFSIPAAGGEMDGGVHAHGERRRVTQLSGESSGLLEMALGLVPVAPAGGDGDRRAVQKALDPDLPGVLGEGQRLRCDGEGVVPVAEPELDVCEHAHRDETVRGEVTAGRHGQFGQIGAGAGQVVHGGAQGASRALLMVQVGAHGCRIRLGARAATGPAPRVAARRG